MCSCNSAIPQWCHVKNHQYEPFYPVKVNKPDLIEHLSQETGPNSCGKKQCAVYICVFHAYTPDNTIWLATKKIVMRTADCFDDTSASEWKHDRGEAIRAALCKLPMLSGYFLILAKFHTYIALLLSLANFNNINSQLHHWKLRMDE